MIYDFAVPTALYLADDMYDITIQNARVIDGAGLPSYKSDIAIKGDRIAAIGEINASAGRTMGRDDHLRRSERSIHNPFRTQRQNAQGIFREWRHPRIFHGG